MWTCEIILNLDGNQFIIETDFTDAMAVKFIIGPGVQGISM